MHYGKSPIASQSNEIEEIEFNRRMNFIKFDYNTGEIAGSNSNPDLKEMLNRSQHLHTIIEKRWENI